jgi:hypothetical protein
MALCCWYEQKKDANVVFICLFSFIKSFLHSVFWPAAGQPHKAHITVNTSVPCTKLHLSPHNPMTFLEADAPTMLNGRV